MEGPFVRCLMVETGQEKTVLQLLRARKLGKGMCPQRTRIRKIRGIWRQDQVRLIPGYVFVYSDTEIPIRFYYRMERLLKVLRYDREPEGYLQGADLELALALNSLDGRLGLLDAREEEDGFIRITDPRLEALGGEVLSVERRKRLARVRISLLGEPRILPMNYRLTGEDGQPLTPTEEIVIDMVEDETDEWLTAWTPDFSDELMEKIDMEEPPEEGEER